MPALATQANWPRIVQKDLSIVFDDQYRQFESMIGAVCTVKEATQGTEYDLEVGDIGEMSEFNEGSISFSSPTEGYRKSVTEQQWALGIKATRQLLRNDLYGVLRNRAAALADSARDRRETTAAQLFVDGFTSSFTSGDTLSFFNSAHTNAQNALTQDNSGTSAFSPSAVEATRLLILKHQTNAGNKMAARMDMLIVPADLEEKAYELIKSSGKIDTANNNRNFHQGKYKLVVWENYLSDVNNWFAADSKLLKRHHILREWEPTQFFRSGEFDTMVSKFAVYMSLNSSAVDWRGVYGHLVS